ncbi:MAG: hypothetical protein DVB25_03390 [Verrucomicrobia bacterium]|nr:MAG: hypothetical protein DVB25_03390 [Verrucomicrobiota bacterium]
MNPLPLRKKSPEELAKLRQTFGILPSPPAAQTPDERPSLASAPKRMGALPLPSAKIPADVAAPQRQLRPPSRSFKRSEHRPKLEADTPSLTATDATPSPLPLRRHSAQELAHARRHDALAVISRGAYQLPTAAHPVLLVCGYLLACGGAAAPTLLDGLSRLTGSYTLAMAWSQGYHLLTACTLAALVVAAVIYARNSLSRHHAAFIAIIVFFALVFSVIHYFSQLRHAT